MFIYSKNETPSCYDVYILPIRVYCGYRIGALTLSIIFFLSILSFSNRNITVSFIPEMNVVSDSTSAPINCPKFANWIDDEMDLQQCAPHFIILGGMKCGTTSLWEYLVQHPSVLAVKKHHYFMPPEFKARIDKQIFIFKNKTKKEWEWLYPTLRNRTYPKPVERLLNMTASFAKADRNGRPRPNINRLVKVNRPIIGDKEVRFFGPSLYQTAHYFADRWQQTIEWYLGCFPTIPKKKEGPYWMNHGKIAGEGSPTFFHGGIQIFQRINNYLPDVRIIILLRNPVDRFLSGQRMLFQMKSAISQFKNKTAKQIKLDDVVPYSNAGKGVVKKDNKGRAKAIRKHVRRVNTELTRGVYITKVKQVFQTFDPTQILVLQSEFFYKNTTESMHQIEDFLRIENMQSSFWNKRVDKVYNLKIDGDTREFHAEVGKQEPVVFSAENRILVQNFYRKHNRELAGLLKVQFNGWDY